MVPPLYCEARPLSLENEMKLKPRGPVALECIAYTGTRARPGTVLLYTVSGRGIFPADMLRYDNVRIVGADVPTERLREATEFAIEGDGCTPERWRSFGWSVIPGTVIEAAP
jgi:hypothetical protein